jgi:hypothetical protein
LPPNLRRFARSFFLGVWVYSLILWGWIGLNFYIDPKLQTGPLSLYIRIPQNLIAVIAFPVSFIAFVLWSYLRRESE